MRAGDGDPDGAADLRPDPAIAGPRETAPAGGPERPSDGLTRAAARALGASAVLLTFVDADHRGFASRAGPLPEPWASAGGTPGTAGIHPFCRHVVATGRPLVVRDAREPGSTPEGLGAGEPVTGERGAVAYAGVPLLTADGRTIGCLCAVERAARDWTADDLVLLADLAAAAVARVELRAAEERYRLSARATRDVVWEWDLATGVPRRGEPMTAVFGHAAGEVPAGGEGGAWVAAQLHPDERDRVLESVRRALDGDAEVWTAEYRFRRADGTYAVVLDRGYIARDQAGRPRRVVGAMRDVTEEVRRRLRAERLQALTAALSIAATPDAVAEAVVTHAAAAFEAAGAVIACLTPDGEQLEIMRVGDLPDDVRDAWRRFPVDAPVPLADVTRTREPLFLESRAAWGARYPELAPLLDATGHHANAVVPLVVNGQALGVLGVAFAAPRPFDEEERAAVLTVAQQCALALERARLYEAERAARAEAEAANRAKGDFLAAMSHELRTPLNAIAGHVQLLAMELHGPVTDAQRGAFGRIEVAQRHLLRLVNDVLNFARLQAGRLEYDVRAVSVADVVAELEPMIGPQLAAKSLAYTVDVPAGCTVLADRDKLVQVLLNLLSNAVKFTPPGGRVALECVHRADGTDLDAPAGEASGAGAPATVFLRVTDTGVGIPRDKQRLVFEPFVQVDTTLAGRAAGAGLGLAISRDLARGMGGDLRVRSTVGAGTTFTVALPGG